ncbi:MAG: hypothetical protein M9904_04170 [Chitinophagaceae bacterium]|nr:hypothetical protein [Chitinophagaceae bacterium]
MTTKNWGRGIFARMPFDNEARKQFREKWSKMTDSEKLGFANERFGSIGEDRFSVEKLDELCNEWSKMTAEEKQAFVDERKHIFGTRMHGMCDFGEHRHL